MGLRPDQGNTLYLITLTWIINKRKDNEDVNNYRPVTLMSVLAKLFEMCLYSKLVGYSGITRMQYGFEKRVVLTITLSFM